MVGDRSSAAAYALRDFLTRNGLPYDWQEVDGTGDTVDPADLPLCILRDGRRIARATVEQVAAGIGMISPPQLDVYDLVIVGAGPAGLGAAVYATSEGLTTAVIEGVAPGGQAGTTSLIENYLGFPTGISGGELATRAVSQARRIGAEILLARPPSATAAESGGFRTEPPYRRDGVSASLRRRAERGAASSSRWYSCGRRSGRRGSPARVPLPQTG